VVAVVAASSQKKATILVAFFLHEYPFMSKDVGSFAQRRLRAQALIRTQCLDEARDLLQALCAENGHDVLTWHLLATVHGMLGSFETSAECSRHALAIQPDFVEAWVNLANAHKHAGRHRQAVEAFQQVMSLQPGVQVQHEIAGLFRQLGEGPRALQAYRQAIELQPQTAELYYNLGTLQQDLGQYSQAVDSYRKALELKPGLVQAWNNLGLVYQEQGLLDEAMDCFDRALETGSDDVQPNPARAEVHRHRALLRLLRGEFSGGWSEYEWRHTDPDAVQRSLPFPVWDGSPLTNKTILVYGEQGVGDEIMFAACFPSLVRQAGGMVMECESRLEPLFRRSFPDARVIAAGKDGKAVGLGEVPEIDYCIAAGSLPGYLPAFPEVLAAQESYLVADPARLEKWRDRYAQLGAGFKVGISWRGGRVAAKQRKRSTTLTQWRTLFNLSGVQFINLQYGDCTRELQQANASLGVQIHDWCDVDPLCHLDDFAAQLAALDLVISVDNATVHMAGALGVPVWVLQPFAPEWRWLLECEDSYWYDSVRQFRQSRHGDWQGVFTRVRQALEKRLAML